MRLNNQLVQEFGLPTAIVHEALVRLGDGRYRVSHIKQAMRHSYSDCTIKRALINLVRTDVIERRGETGDPRGYFYSAKKKSRRSDSLT